jgi:quercetin dioxygenase-like cupin family protein
MHVINFSPEHATPVGEYGSRAATAQRLGDGHGETHVYVVHLGAGGEIGPHPAGFAQLYCVVTGSGWVAGADGVRHELRAGQAAVIVRGEIHAKGSVTGSSALMIQCAELTALGAYDVADRPPTNTELSRER